MSQIISFQETPPARFDLVPWTSVLVQEAASVSGSYTTIDTIDFQQVDVDPANPKLQEFTTTLGTAPAQWYRLVYADDAGGQSAPTVPVLNGVSFSYTDTTELARVLKIRTPSDAQTAAMQRVLDAAAGEINSEIGRTEGLAAWEQQLATEVNIERAVEHWQQQEAAFGVIGLGSESPVYTATNSWDRHANKLAPLKQSWGIA